jgi:hypothetical protein
MQGGAAHLGRGGSGRAVIDVRSRCSYDGGGRGGDRERASAGPREGEVRLGLPVDASGVWEDLDIRINRCDVAKVVNSGRACA